jgi:S-ribosylhomocysteine lyase LuxS involved in autoinducer biosynthesis
VLTRQDCLALCELSEEEVAAIAEHEHVPELVAMELGQYLCHTPEGEARIERMIVDDIAHARETGNFAHMAKLVAVLRHFIENHPHR